MLLECNPNLKKLSFHDVNLADHQKEVLLLLQDPMLQEITFSFCRLFESCTTEFLSEIINTVKRNSSLKSLKLPGNRLGNHRLVALADIFSEDSSSSLCQLDVSSNCIKPDGLLEFTKKLEGYIQQRGGKIQFTHLRLFQNWLDQDAETAQEALRRLRAVCSVVNDSWDSSQAFADYISVMWRTQQEKADQLELKHFSPWPLKLSTEGVFFHWFKQETVLVTFLFLRRGTRWSNTDHLGQQLYLIFSI